MHRVAHIHYLGLWTLYRKEVWRFMKVYNQTLIAPVVNVLLLLAIFSLAMQDRVAIGGMPFVQFMVPGLIMMAIVQNAFANTSSSLIMGKVLGSIIDLLLPPLSAAEITVAMVSAAITRAVMVGLLVGVSVAFFVPTGMHDVLWGIAIVLLASMMLALLGMLGGILADSFDQMSAITSYVVTPLSFLSGTFYSVKQLPTFWQHVNDFNPFFYMIDGFRYSMTGYHDASLTLGIWVLLLANLGLVVAVYHMMARGYRIKM